MSEAEISRVVRILQVFQEKLLRVGGSMLEVSLQSACIRFPWASGESNNVVPFAQLRGIGAVTTRV